jgi:ERCC4-type nuclease
MRIIVDTREQRPWSFEAFDDVELEVATLRTGDYSLAGHEAAVSIERKSADDLVNTLIHGRERFERELERMLEFRHRAIIVEAGVDDILAHRYTSRTHPNSVLGMAASIQVRYEIPVVWGGSRAATEAYAYRLFRALEKSLDIPPPPA